jgi:predicted signal transduction protein with EAL and GGDEF domain
LWLHDISACVRRLVEELSAPYLLGKKDCHVTLSVGISVFPADGSDSLALLKSEFLKIALGEQHTVIGLLSCYS